MTHSTETGRAPYALPPGTPALQEDPARTRRWLLAAGVGGLVVGLGGGYWGVKVFASSSAPKTENDRREWARRIANSPTEIVLQNAIGFLGFVDVYGADSHIWVGVAKLVEYSEGVPEAQAGVVPLRERLLATLRSRRAELPPVLASALSRLDPRKSPR